MKSIQTSSILKVLAILLVNGTLIANKDTLQTQMLSMAGKVNTTPPEGMVMKDGVATVAIVYPRHFGDIDPCTTETNKDGKRITDVIVETTTRPFCELDNAQINHLAADKALYEKEIFCNCIVEFCGSTPQSAEFVECVKKTERL